MSSRDRRLDGSDFGLAYGTGGLDLDDDGVIEVDQVIGCIGEERQAAVCCSPPRAAGSTGAKYFGVTGVAAPKAESSSTAKYSRTARRDRTGSNPSAPRTPLWRLASALIRLASTAKPSPPTNPSAMQRRTMVSNTCRNRSLSRNRP